MLDLREIAFVIAEDSLDASDRFLLDAERAFELLAQMPGIGSARRFRRKSLRGLRLWPLPQFPKYLVLYYPREDWRRGRACCTRSKAYRKADRLSIVRQAASPIRPIIGNTERP